MGLREAWGYVRSRMTGGSYDTASRLNGY
jgi:hypothetical protein